ncbi:MAG: 23S rRNA (adenine(2030)-N(6))-methyltransferase RlmJ [Caulobacteraceae bacterium]
MNYRHAFHAGNFADLLKHAVLTHLLRALTAAPGPLTVIDTHAGAGLYDLAGDSARRTGEGQAGIVQLMAAADAPAAFADLRAGVMRANAPGAVRFYPGSPILIGEILRPRDRLIACELRPDDHGALKGVLPRHVGAEIVKADGWEVAAARVPAAPGRLLVFVDPPFESGDDPARAAALVASVLSRNPGATIALWAPIKDLAGFDTFLTGVEDAAGAADVLVAETRLRPLADPMAMNGCAMVVVNPPTGLAEPALAAAAWIARELGGGGALGRVW